MCSYISLCLSIYFVCHGCMYDRVATVRVCLVYKQANSPPDPHHVKPFDAALDHKNQSDAGRELVYTPASRPQRFQHPTNLIVRFGDIKD